MHEVLFSKSGIRNQKSEILDGLFGLGFFLLYLITLIPSVLPADNGEFQLVAWKLGIAHPPGYPLYTIVGFLFTRFFTSPAFALNLLSAILAAITLVIVSRTVRLLTRSIIAGLLAAALLGVSTTFWAQATTANIRMLTALFTALCVYILVNWSHSQIVKQSSGHLVTSKMPHAFCGTLPRHLVTLPAFAFVFSLGLGHHLSLIYPGLLFILYIFSIDPALLKQPRRWIKPLVFFGIGLLVLLYLPIRGTTGGTLADGESMTFLAEPAKFVDYISGRGFEGDFFYFITARPDLFWDRVALLPTLFAFQFQPLVVIFVVIGAVRLIAKDRKLASMLIGGMILLIFVGITYRAPQTVEYLMPAYALMAIIIGYGLSTLHITRYSSSRSIPAGLITNVLRVACGVLIVIMFVSNLPSYQWLRQDEDTRAYAESLLNDAPPNAIVLSNWHWANPLWYLQQVEGVRPDVTVQYVFPRGEALATSWLNSIEAGLKTNQPVVVDMFFRNEFNNSQYYFSPISSEAYQACLDPCPVPLASFVASDINFDSKLRVIGYKLLNDSTRPGEPLTLFIAYRVESQSDRNTSLFAHLVKPDGSVIGQSDRTVATQRYHIGDVIVERFFVAPLMTVEPGEYALMTGAYTIGDDGQLAPLKSNGQDRAAITTAKVVASDQPIDHTGIALSSGITFVRSNASTTSELHPGDRLTLDLKFIARRPIMRDIVVSVQMNGSNWRVIDDSVPALGAIPTLKWIARTEIVDRHVLTIPKEASGQATVTLSLYDAFTQEPLALLDTELIKQGPTIPIGTYNIKK
jgi:4-amino-4-deoxy-L-arabinose transferase-like glycosyltransferase